jgi:prepilin-type processing-associated H-X9-DG protein
MDAMLHAESRGRCGAVLLRALALAAVLSVVLATLYAALDRMRQSLQCANNLSRIYSALEMYELAEGALPPFSFFPDEPRVRTDPAGKPEEIPSLRSLVETYETETDLCVCPSAPAVLAELGLTFVWNVALSGKPLPAAGERQWMLIEMQAVLPELPAPHMGRFNVLYTDGTVERLREPHRSLEGL